MKAKMKVEITKLKTLKAARESGNRAFSSLALSDFF